MENVESEGRETPSVADPAREAGSFLAATVFGIPVRIHGMYSILMLVFGGIGAATGAWETALFLPIVLLVCALHELGHAAMAQRLGYAVQSIVLHPFRGRTPVQRPDRPFHEAGIALAGPGANLLTAVLVGGVVLAFGRSAPGSSAAVGTFLGSGPAGRFVAFNLFLGLLNLVPAFPLDGGHALRALLAARMSRANAGRRAAQVSLCAVVLFVTVGFMHANLYWALFALLITVGTSQEMSSATFFAAIKDLKARDAMQASLHLLPLAQTLNGIVGSGLPATQRFFPVTCGNEVFGILSRSRMEAGIRSGKGDTYVAQWMNRQMVFVNPNEPLKAALERSRLSPGSPLLVGEPGHLLGMITLESVQKALSVSPSAQTIQKETIKL